MELEFSLTCLEEPNDPIIFIMAHFSILPSMPRYCSCSFLQVFLTNTMYAILPLPMSAKCFAQLIPLDFFLLIIFDKEFNLSDSSYVSLLTYSRIGADILLGVCSQTPSVCVLALM